MRQWHIHKHPYASSDSLTMQLSACSEALVTRQSGHMLIWQSYTRAPHLFTATAKSDLAMLCCHAGLLQFVAQAQLEEAVQKEQAQKVEPAPGSLGVGKDSIYVGKGQYIQV